MKRIISVILAACLLLAFSGVASAESERPLEELSLEELEAAMEYLTGQEAVDAFNEYSARTIRMEMEKKGYTQVEAISPAAARDEIDVDPQTLALANSDLESASSEEQEKILAARNKVIYQSSGWYADDGRIYMVYVDEERKEWHELPKFSELFPGWDLPTEQASESEQPIKAEEPVEDLADLISLAAMNVTRGAENKYTRNI
ncbi:MAG: hypothetical protein HFE94_02075 [Acutalibacter sp.]|nr:hypothetical protein [Acutalibacter sp.]